MKICIFGLGYVGCVSIACFANDGHEVTGVDLNPSKIDMINKGLSTIIEKDIDILIKSGWDTGKIKATTDFEIALQDSDFSIICVGTPNDKNGHLDVSNIYRVAENIGMGLIKTNKFHIVLIRSTVLPGTNEKVGSIIEKLSGKKRDKDFEVVSNPEFLREGTAVHDFYNPPFTVIGTDSELAFENVKNLYLGVNAPILRTSVKVAELIKLVNNSWHALKVAFANEIGNICKRLNIDSQEVMDLFCEDKKLNLSSYYLKPGFAYGGSCLPKDLSALKMIAYDNYIKIPLIDAIEQSNNQQKQLLIEMVTSNGFKRIGFLGLSFKAGTDDLRNSPIVEVVEALIGKGFEIMIYDKNVHLSNLIGANKQYIIERIPHLEKLISDNLYNVIDYCDLIVIANKEKEFADLIPLCANKSIIDLVRIDGNFKTLNDNYEGICW